MNGALHTSKSIDDVSEGLHRVDNTGAGVFVLTRNAMQEYEFRPDNDFARPFLVDNGLHWRLVAVNLLGNSNSNSAFVFKDGEFAGFVSRGKFPYAIWRPNREVMFLDLSLQESVNYTREVLYEDRVYTLLLSGSGMCVDYLAAQSRARKYGKRFWNEGSGNNRFSGVSRQKPLFGATFDESFVDEEGVVIGCLRDGVYDYDLPYRGNATDIMFRHEKWEPPSNKTLAEIIRSPWV